ncbi:MAG: hypothetical protein KGY99_02615 [Phycisphaerae bacterium]|nr:hypothetical protein [Phycisphaerae bacterium]
MPESKRNTRVFPLVTLVLAWLLPGAGHVYIGRIRRGIVLFVVIAALFWSGVAIGGVMTVDSRRQRWWFVAEMLSGVHGLTAWRISESVLTEVLNDAGVAMPLPPGSQEAFNRNARVDDALASKRLALTAPTATVARAYAGVAGLINLLCIFDALMLSLMGTYGEPTPPRRAGAARDEGGGDAR